MTFWSRNISVAIGVLKYYIFSSAIFGILREDSHFSKVTGWSYFSKCSPHQLKHFLSSFATRPTLHNRSPVQQKTLHFHDNEKCVKTSIFIRQSDGQKFKRLLGACAAGHNDISPVCHLQSCRIILKTRTSLIWRKNIKQVLVKIRLCDALLWNFLDRKLYVFFCIVAFPIKLFVGFNQI